MLVRFGEGGGLECWVGGGYGHVRCVVCEIEIGVVDWWGGRDGRWGGGKGGTGGREGRRRGSWEGWGLGDAK